MATITIKPIERTSPCLAESMRVCLLQAGISKADNSDDYVLSHPAAWLGNAYHEVLERGPSPGISNQDLSLRVQEIWTNSIRAQCDKNKHHPLNRRYSDPVKWPKYTLVQAVAQVRAEELAAALSTVSGSASEGTSTGTSPLREKWLETNDGKLGGKPDFISSEEVRDYKSGNIYEGDSSSNAGDLKGAYARQIKIYGHLVRANLGYLPTRGAVMPLSGQSELVPLSEAECEEEARTAISLLDEYNSKVVAGIAPADLASSSPGSCAWCGFKLICPAFWYASSPDWASEFWGAALSGELAADPETIHNGDAVALEVAVDQGTIEGGQVRISPLPVSIFENVRDLKVGTRVQVTGLLVKPDESVRPYERTLINSQNDLPEILVEP